MALNGGKRTCVDAPRAHRTCHDRTVEEPPYLSPVTATPSVVDLVHTASTTKDQRMNDEGRRHTPFGVGLVLVGLIVVGGCRSEAPVERLNRLIIGTRTEPRTLDPAFARRAGAQEIVRLIYRDLTDFDDKWQLVPSLAAALPTATATSGGAWMVDWQLRSGMKWSDGTPITASDIVFGHRIEADSRWGAVNHEDAKLVDRIVALDPLRVRVMWRQSFPAYRAPRVHAILPSHAYPEPTRASAFSGIVEPSASSGPFRIERWVRGEQLVLTANPHWIGPAPHLEQIVFRFLRSEDAIETELLAGTIDAVGEAGGLSPGRAVRIAERLRDSHEVVLTNSAVRLGVECRLDHPILGRADVRRALSAIVDRKVFGKIAYGGAALAARGLFPPRHPAHFPEERTERPEDAREVLARLQGNAPIPLQFAADSDAARRAAVFLQNVWSRAGFPVVLDGKPFRVLLEKLAARAHGPMVLLALRMRPDWDAQSTLRHDGPQNYGGYRDSEVEGWISEARSATDPAEWRAALINVERRFRRDLPSIPLLFRRTASVRPTALRGWRPTGTTTPVTWNAEAWRWSQVRTKSK